jgi:inner membrane protein involved in colicin E2 resistance
LPLRVYSGELALATQFKVQVQGLTANAKLERFGIATVEASINNRSNQIKSDQIRTDQIRTNQNRSDQNRSDQNRLEQIRSDQIRTDQIRLELCWGPEN